jgi:hypothetical protein
MFINKDNNHIYFSDNVICFFKLSGKTIAVKRYIYELYEIYPASVHNRITINVNNMC